MLERGLRYRYRYSMHYSVFCARQLNEAIRFHKVANYFRTETKAGGSTAACVLGKEKKEYKTLHSKYSQQPICMSNFN